MPAPTIGKHHWRTDVSLDTRRGHTKRRINRGYQPIHSTAGHFCFISEIRGHPCGDPECHCAPGLFNP